jgi:mono/diheme cytochrome c family protein
VHPLLERPVPDVTIVRRLDRHRRMAELLVEAAPPPAPLPSSRDLHARGRAVFEEACARCHGTYRQEQVSGRLVTTVASYDEKLVPVETVGTDPAYDASQDEEFNARIRATPIGKLYGETCTGHSYVARPLLGARLRFPYLHNASVPSLRALLEPPERRPAAFWVGADAPLDEEGCGYGAGEPRGPRARRRETTVDGNRASGHPFGTTLGDEEKKALIAYLKSL